MPKHDYHEAKEDLAGRYRDLQDWSTTHRDVLTSSPEIENAVVQARHKLRVAIGHLAAKEMGL